MKIPSGNRKDTLRLARQIVATHKPEYDSGNWYCPGCPEEDWGHRDMGPALAPCERYLLAKELLKR